MPTKRRNTPPPLPDPGPPAAAPASGRPSSRRKARTTPAPQADPEPRRAAAQNGAWISGGKGAGPRNAIGGARNSSASAPRQAGMGLHTADGLRKYLTAGERDGFLR